MLQMFGDVGGLNDFLVLICALYFKFFAEKLMLRELGAKLFYYSTLKVQGFESPLAALSKIKSLKTNKLFLDRKRKYFLGLAKTKLDTSLDVVRLIRASRIQRTLTRLLLSKSERQWIRFQRREVVLDQSSLKKPSETSSDAQVLKKFKR